MALIEVAERLVKPSGWYHTPIREARVPDFKKMAANLKTDSKETVQATFSGRLMRDIIDVFDPNTGKIADDSWFIKSHPRATLGELFDYYQGTVASGKRKPSLEGFDNYLNVLG